MKILDNSQNMEIKARVWPAALIALSHVVVAHGFSRWGATNIHNAIALGGVPLLALLLLTVWWFGASRTPWRDRLLGGQLLALSIGVIVFSQASAGMGGLLLAKALPYLIVGLGVLLVLTCLLGWRMQRWLLVIYLLAWAGVFCAMRVDSIGGDLWPVTSWRWTPSATLRSEVLPALEVQQTALTPETAQADDWPAFLGVARDGRVADVRFSTDWRKPPRELWRREIGAAWSSFILVGNYLFTQEQRGAEELVSCYHADTGKAIWQHRIRATFEDAMGLGPRATPAFHEGKLYSLGGTGMLHCLDAATGAPVWDRNVTQDANTRVPGYGFTSSPLVNDNHVIVFTSGAEDKSVIAYNRLTGDIAWHGGRRTSGYSSPQLAMIGDTRQLLMVSNFGMQAFQVDDGAVLWEHHWDISTNPRCVQPVVWQGRYVLFGGTGASGTRLLHVSRQQDGWITEEQWTTRRVRPYFNNGVLHKDHYYGYDGERVSCLDMETGERLWSGERYSGQMLLIEAMDLLLILSESGDVALVQATPERFQEVARFKALSGKTWNHPLVAKGRLFVRNDTEAACFALDMIPAP